MSTRNKDPQKDTLNEEVFNRMMTRMQNTARTSQQQQQQSSANANKNNKNFPRKPQTSRSSSSQNINRNKNAESAIEQLPQLIKSLRGALTPKNTASAISEFSGSGNQLQQQQILQQQGTSPIGHSAMFLKHEHDKEVEVISRRRDQLLYGSSATTNAATVGDQSSSSATELAAKHKLQQLPSSSSADMAKNLIKAVTVSSPTQQKGSTYFGSFSQHVAQNATSDAETTAMIEARNDAAIEIETRVFGGGPVPTSLRSVVGELRQEVESRLKLADISSFKNCVQSLFECRSLLDQVLKQIPSHWHFRDEQLNKDSFSSSSEQNISSDQKSAEELQKIREQKFVQQQQQQMMMGEMLEDARKASQVHVHSSNYVVDQSSGKLEIEKVSVPKQQNIAPGIPGIRRSSSAVFQQQQQPHARRHSHTAVSIIDEPDDEKDKNTKSSTYSKHQEAKDHEFPNYSHLQNLPLQIQQQVISPPVGTSDSANLAHALHLIDPLNPSQLAQKNYRHQTQTMSSSCQTDIFMQDDLSREDFEFQEKKVKDLAVLIKEYEGTVQRLRNQLRVAQGALATRGGTVTYIRETLFKECSILRTQLQVLQQYYLNHQNAQQTTTSIGSPHMMMQQQQQQQQMTGNSPSKDNASSTSDSAINPNSPSHLTTTTTARLRGTSFARNVQQTQSNVTNISTTGGAGLSAPTPTPHAVYSSMGFYPPASSPTTMTTTGSNLPPAGTTTTTMMMNTQNISSSSTNTPNKMNYSPLSQKIAERPPPFSTLALQPLAPLHSLLDTILLAVENEEVLVHQNNSPNSPTSPTKQQQNLVGTEVIATEPSKDSQLRELRGQFAEQQAHWKKEVADARSKFSLAMRTKNEQLRKITLASNVIFLRTTLLQMMGEFKQYFGEFRTGIKSAMKLHSNFLAHASQDIRFGISQASKELEQHNKLLKEREALKDIIFAVPDLILPTLAPEFAMGYHSWSFADSNDPLKSYTQTHHGHEIADSMKEELVVLHDLFVEVQRFGVRIHQLPDVHRPKPGWLMSKVAQGLLRAPNSTNDLASSIRTLLERDDALAKMQAKVNIALHGVIIRRKVLADRIRAALREGEIDCVFANSKDATLEELTSQSPWSSKTDASRLAAITATYADIPTCASRFSQFAEDIDMYHIKRMKLQQQRMETARQLFQLWRNSGIDVTGGRYAIVSRDPDQPWMSGLVKTRRLRGPRVQTAAAAANANLPSAALESELKKEKQQQQSSSAESSKMAVSGRYHTSGSSASAVSISRSSSSGSRPSSGSK